MKAKAGYYYDIANLLTIEYLTLEVGARNSGDYHHHDWFGPYKTFNGAKRAGLKELKFQVAWAQKRMAEFEGVQENKK